jgi:protein ImuB
MPRYASIWFPYLLTEYTARKKPGLRQAVFVLASRQRGRMVIESASAGAMKKGIRPGMVVADCKAIFPELQVFDAEPGRADQLLHLLAEWCIRYTPFAAVDLPDGLVLDTTGCTHLWGGEAGYLESIRAKLNAYGYTVRGAIADTIGAAWAIARFGNQSPVVDPREQREALRLLPPAALRLEQEVLARLKKLGLERIESFMDMPQTVLRRRFGPSLPFRLSQVLGREIEMIVPVKPVEPYHERLQCIELISTATGIRIAIQQLLEALCKRFEAEGIGLRHAIFSAYRVDGDVQQIEIGTVHPSRTASHLYRLFEHKIATLEPALGFELFLLEAPKVEPISDSQGMIWNISGQDDKKVMELLDRVEAKIGPGVATRYLPAEHYLPERSIKQAMPLWEKPVSGWHTHWPRPIHLLQRPEAIEVTAVMPDYPPMLFRYEGKLFNITKSDGPERIEQEWWIRDGLYRDYYCVEDESGARYWLFRSGPYNTGRPKWFIHGFFA